MVTKTKKSAYRQTKEAIWDLDKMMDMAGVRARCTRRHAPNATKNVKFLLNPAETVLSTARNAFRNAEIVTVNK